MDRQLCLSWIHDAVSSSLPSAAAPSPANPATQPAAAPIPPPTIPTTEVDIPMVELSNSERQTVKKGKMRAVDVEPEVKVESEQEDMEIVDSREFDQEQAEISEAVARQLAGDTPQDFVPGSPPRAAQIPLEQRPVAGPSRLANAGSEANLAHPPEPDSSSDPSFVDPSQNLEKELGEAFGHFMQANAALSRAEMFYRFMATSYSLDDSERFHVLGNNDNEEVIAVQAPRATPWPGTASSRGFQLPEGLKQDRDDHPLDTLKQDDRILAMELAGDDPQHIKLFRHTSVAPPTTTSAV
ncbi:hypothetical protein V5O48_015903, partial [Marasmius crinis-equi]